MNRRLTGLGGIIKNILLLILALITVFLPLITSAQTSLNHPPQVTSTPLTLIAADKLYQYQLTATDRENDTTIFSLTAAPTGMTLDNGKITWQPDKVGVYSVIVQAADQRGAYDNQTWQINVSAGAVAEITITPYERPSVINLGETRQFTAAAADAKGNAVDQLFTWTTEKRRHYLYRSESIRNQ